MSSHRQTNIQPSQGVVAGEKVDVQSGDTVYSVARRYGVSMRDVIALNHLEAPFTLVPGSRLSLPVKESMMDASRPLAYDRPQPTIELGPMALDKEAYNTYQDTIGANGKKTYEQIVPERRREPEKEYRTENASPVLGLTGKKADEKTQPVKEEGKKDPLRTRNELAEALNLKPMHYDQAQKKLKHVTDEKNSLPKQLAEPEVRPKNQSGKMKEPDLYKKSEPGLKTPEAPKETEKKYSFIWPLQGPIISTYGPKSNGLKNDGINIGAPRGTPVVASDGGTVAYAGSDIPGYGNIVLVRHPNGLMTTYAHLERMFVQKDVIVAKGDMVGTAGTSGGLDTPQLHFEIRRGNDALDPAKYLYAH